MKKIGNTPTIRFIKENKTTSLFETFPEAISLFFVRSTITSNFLSLKSFQIHPKDLMPQAPKKNIMQR